MDFLFRQRCHIVPGVGVNCVLPNLVMPDLIRHPLGRDEGRSTPDQVRGDEEKKKSERMR
ncbi:hypothetical protein ATE63_16765 [Sphingopyxis sp. H067]|nr:hypothetical protein ATE61_15690 [Sphingopyxis sp. H057]KTE51126.1 hypothetical protein ATE64_14635 [Sphingopyxis sp. H073]KTE69708.1 hypothetical protein ATE60_16750 [Sphingopyxis sp. H081]KTE79216.1 hypothetical protein ATE63_16765 [Sphingopyxis sp. H067]